MLVQIDLKVPLDAVPQGRPRFANGRAIDPQRSRDFKEAFRLFVQSKLHAEYQLEKPLETPLVVEIYFYRSKARFKRRTDMKFGDIDNLTKAVLDALNGVTWKDDRQIVALHAEKRLSDVPHIELWITEDSKEC